MKTKVEQMIWILLAFLICGAFIWFLQSPTVIGMVAGVYVMVIGAFLGIDLKNMIKETKIKPAGDYKAMNKSRYIISVITMVLLCAESMALSKLFEKEVTAVYASVGVGALIVIGMVVSGIEANKGVTEKDNSWTKPIPIPKPDIPEE